MKHTHTLCIRILTLVLCLAVFGSALADSVYTADGDDESAIDFPAPRSLR